MVKSGASLLGLYLFLALYMCIEGNKFVTATSRDDPFDPPTVQRAPTIPSTVPQTALETRVQEMECATGKLQLKTDAVPVQQKLRRLPVFVRQAVTDELKDLQEKNIIERADASPRVSSTVVAQRKETGKPHMCVDLRESNKSIISDCHLSDTWTSCSLICEEQQSFLPST